MIILIFAYRNVIILTLIMFFSKINLLTIEDSCSIFHFYFCVNRTDHTIPTRKNGFTTEKADFQEKKQQKFKATKFFILLFFHKKN